MKPRLSLALPVALLGACTFNAPAPSSYRCSKEQPTCPAGQTCVGNLCVSTSAGDARPDQPGQPRLEGGVDRTQLDGRGIDGRKLDGPRIDGPRADLPKVDLPKVDLPKGDLPKGDLPKPCGNGVIGAGEDCDGALFPSGLDTCQAYNRNGGTLNCSPVTCKVDLSKCCAAAVPPPTTPAVTRTVSSTVGVNAPSQPLCTPYKTITAALANAPQGSVVWVMPGNYTQSVGEVFPIQIPQTVVLFGDEPNRGLGSGTSGPTLISGSGPGPVGPVTIIGAGTARLAGFRITGPSTAGTAILVPGHFFNISKNTVDGLNGVLVQPGSTSSACPHIIDNTFNVSELGVQTDCPSTQIQSNTFKSATGIFFLAGGNTATIHGNTFDGCQSYGIRINAGSPNLTNNNFTGGVGAFSTAAISVGASGAASSATPKIRGTIFPALLPVTGVRIAGTGKPDLGIGSGDLGNNKLGVTRLELSAANTTVSAVGNDWAPPTTSNPTCSPPLPQGSGQVQITGTNSTVIYGTGGGQNCHNP